MVRSIKASRAMARSIGLWRSRPVTQPLGYTGAGGLWAFAVHMAMRMRVWWVLAARARGTGHGGGRSCRCPCAAFPSNEPIPPNTQTHKHTNCHNVRACE